MTNENDMAFSCYAGSELNLVAGLTKLELAAFMAMQGMLAACNGFSGNEHGEAGNLAKCAVIQAKALITELNKNP